MVTNLNYVQEEIKAQLNVGTFDLDLLLLGLLSQHLSDILPFICIGVKLGFSLQRETETFEDNSTVRRIFRTQTEYITEDQTKYQKLRNLYYTPDIVNIMLLLCTS